MGIVGNAIGTVPAIANDINGGMDPTKAIVSEGGGTAAGVVAGGVAAGIVADAAAGAAIGSVVPGVGTAAGLVVGTVVGGAVAYLGSKGIQKVWPW